MPEELPDATLRVSFKRAVTGLQLAELVRQAVTELRAGNFAVLIGDGKIELGQESPHPDRHLRIVPSLGVDYFELNTEYAGVLVITYLWPHVQTLDVGGGHSHVARGMAASLASMLETRYIKASRSGTFPGYAGSEGE